MNKITLFLMLLFVSCQNKTDNATASNKAVVSALTEEKPAIQNVEEEKPVETVDCTDKEAVEIKEKLAGILKLSNLEGKYRLRCQTKPYFLEGDFDGDKVQDVAILIESTANGKSGILIGNKNKPTTKPTIFGAGKKAFDMDDYEWIGVFEKVPSQTKIEPNWNEETDDFYLEGEVVPKEKIVTLTSDALFVHQSESCGGGYIYWKNGKFNWMQNE